MVVVLEFEALGAEVRSRMLVSGHVGFTGVV